MKMKENTLKGRNEHFILFSMRLYFKLVQKRKLKEKCSHHFQKAGGYPK